MSAPASSAAAAHPPPAGRAHDLNRRLASAAVLAPAGLGALAAGGRSWRLAVLGGAVGVAIEWTGMADRGRLPRTAALLATAAAAAAEARGARAVALATTVGAASLLAGAGEGALGFGVPYVVAPAAALMRIRDGAGGFRTLLMLLLTVWASDTGAYAAGRLVGGPLLAPAISPSKTWAGAGGGLLAAAGVGAGFGRPLLGALLAIAAQGGDLFESFCKRRFGVKDSGRLIPGHGGLLDRLDGLMSAAVVLAVLRVVRRDAAR